MNKNSVFALHHAATTLRAFTMSTLHFFIYLPRRFILNPRDLNSRGETRDYEGNDDTPHFVRYNLGCRPQHNCVDDINMQSAQESEL